MAVLRYRFLKFPMDKKHTIFIFSGSFDAGVFVWDIAGRKGTVFELHGHRNKVTAVRYSGERRILLSTSEDSHLVMWDMAVKRLEVRARLLEKHANLFNGLSSW